VLKIVFIISWIDSTNLNFTVLLQDLGAFGYCIHFQNLKIKKNLSKKLFNKIHLRSSL